MNLFYTDPSDISGSTLVLSEQEARHAVQVMRYRTGDEILVTDGQGGRYRGVIEETDKGTVRVMVQEKTRVEKTVPLVTLLIGMIRKRERLEFAVEKAVELGVSHIVIYNGDHSEKTGVRMERLETTAISAMKQSLRLWLPGIYHTGSLDEAIHQFRAGKVIVADETADRSAIRFTDLSEADSLSVVIGPEGGFSERERELMKKHDIPSISLGRYRLRTETAAIAIASRIIMNEQG